MTLNTSSKICISKRLTITALLLIALGFSVIVFSTLSSSVNKTTSSKAEAPASGMMQNFGGKNEPCNYRSDHNPEYYCNDDTSLVCDGPLDFWLSNKETKQKIRADKKTLLEKGPKCLLPEEVPMGGEGQICRPAILGGKKQCDQEGLVCVNVFGDSLGHTISSTYMDYFDAKYKNTEDRDRFYGFAIGRYFHRKTNLTDGSLVGTYGVCIPGSFTKVESCGDANEKPCLDESGKQICFGDNRIVLLAPEARDTARCVSKITIKAKGLVRCDDGASQTCNEFCAKQNGKCVETCEDKILVDQGNELGAKEMMVKAGMFEVQVYDFKQHPKVSGSCNQDYSPSFGPGTKLPEVCRYNADFVPRCCCDVK